MTETEITLFKELIRETVRSVLKEEKLKMAEEVKKTFAKDLKEIKLLIAKQIKENRERPTQIVETRATAGNAGSPISNERANALNKILGGMGYKKPASPSDNMRVLKESKNMDSMTKNILMQTAMSMTEEDEENLIPGNDLVEDEPQSTGNGYSSEEIEEAYEPKFSNGLPNFPR